MLSMSEKMFRCLVVVLFVSPLGTDLRGGKQMCSTTLRRAIWPGLLFLSRHLLL